MAVPEERGGACGNAAAVDRQRPVQRLGESRQLLLPGLGGPCEGPAARQQLIMTEKHQPNRHCFMLHLPSVLASRL